MLYVLPNVMQAADFLLLPIFTLDPDFLTQT